MAQTLVELSVGKATDKNTEHSYLPLYDQLLAGKRESARAVLEIGIYAGGSIWLWHEYFRGARIVALDIALHAHLHGAFDGKPIDVRIGDAYQVDTVERLRGDYAQGFDVIVDDGPHTLDSMIFTLQHYAPLLTEDGIMIIEDVQDEKWLDALHAAVPAELKAFATSYDLRANKNRWDDLVFVIQKRGRALRFA